MPDVNLGGGWHLDKRISVGHLLTTGSIIFGLVVWSLNIEGKVHYNELRIDTNADSISRLDQKVSTQYTEIIRRLERLDENSAKNADLLYRALERHTSGDK